MQSRWEKTTEWQYVFLSQHEVVRNISPTSCYCFFVSRMEAVVQVWNRSGVGNTTVPEEWFELGSVVPRFYSALQMLWHSASCIAELLPLVN